MNQETKIRISMQRASLYRRVFDSEDGRKVLADMVERYGLLKSAYHASDPYQTVWNDGRRSVVAEIVAACGQELKDLLERKLSYMREIEDAGNHYVGQ